MQESPLRSSDGLVQATVTSQIAFFNELQHESREQFDLLMRHSRLLDYAPGEIIINRSDQEPCFYALIRGSVDVFSSESPSTMAISQLSSGQLFGFLAVLNQDKRSATLTASSPEGAKVLVTDFSIAGELFDFSKVALATKLMLFRNAVNNTRWKLEVYKNSTNDPTLAQELSLFGLFAGKKGAQEELTFLAAQCRELAALLDCWNDVAEPMIAVTGAGASPLNKVISMFKKNRV